MRTICIYIYGHSKKTKADYSDICEILNDEQFVGLMAELTKSEFRHEADELWQYCLSTRKTMQIFPLWFLTPKTCGQIFLLFCQKWVSYGMLKVIKIKETRMRHCCSASTTN